MSGGSVPDENIVDTTGAGDAFTAGLLWGLTQGMSRSQALDFASECGAEAVQSVGPHHDLFGNVTAGVAGGAR